MPALAFDPFTIKDIRIEGIQRTEAGTVFSYLPVKVGDTLTNDKAAQAIKAFVSPRASSRTFASKSKRTSWSSFSRSVRR